MFENGATTWRVRLPVKHRRLSSRRLRIGPKVAPIRASKHARPGATQTPDRLQLTGSDRRQYSGLVSPARHLLVLVAALAAAGPASATAAKRRISCPTGQFVFETPVAIGPPGAELLGHALVFGDGQAAIPGVCPPTRLRLHPGRRGSRLAATWKGCAGARGKVRLKGKTDETCSEITARLRIPKKLKAGGQGPITVKAPQDTCFFDPGVDPLETTGSSVGPVACTSSIDDLAGILEDLCKALQGGASCPSAAPSCARRAQELFTGVTLFPSTVEPPKWNNFGGRGELMAHAALCLLKDLAKGGHTNAASASFGGFGVEVQQRVGFVRFDRAQKLVEGFHHIDLCVPIFGCLTGVGQPFLAQVRTSCPAHPVGQSCGTFPIRAAWALDVAAPEVTRYLPLVAPAITVLTPYGPISVKPSIEFRQHLTGSVSPYGSSVVKDETHAAVDQEEVGGPFLARRARFFDRYGRIPGVIASSTFGNLVDAGWDSQLGLGSRDARAGTNVWTPGAVPNPQRPDHDLGLARSTAENEASTQVTASADIKYSPTDLLPAALRASGVDLSFEVYVTPRLDARVAAQLAFLVSEGWARPQDVGQSPIRHTQLYIRDGAEAGGSFIIIAGFNLKASIDLGFPIGSITLADLHRNLSVPLAGDCRSSTGGACGSPAAWRNAHAASDTAPPGVPAFDGPVRTFHGDVEGQAFLAQCLAEDVPEQAPPEPSFMPSSATSLVEDLVQPCNLCVSVQDHHVHQCAPNPGHTAAECPADGAGNCVGPGVALGACRNVDFDSNGAAQLVLPSNLNPLPADKHWRCNAAYSAGCLDLCIRNSSGLWVVTKSAVDLIGPQCKLEPPA
jgi:hypothetical protein